MFRCPPILPKITAVNALAKKRGVLRRPSIRHPRYSPGVHLRVETACPGRRIVLHASTDTHRLRAREYRNSQYLVSARY